MAERAKYMVTVPPGAPVAGVGFVKPGEVFSAPADDYVPSRTFRAVNGEAKSVLEKLYGELKTSIDERGKDAKPEDKAALKAQAAKLAEDAKKHLVVIELEKEAPKVEQGLTLAELAKLDDKDDPTKPPASSGGKHRAADK